MRQMTLASQASFEKYARKNRHEEFLNVMALVVPWRELEALIEPFYPKVGNGAQPVGLSIMLRVYFLQQWSNLCDPGAEDALYKQPVLLRFAGVDLSRAAVPDESTILRFRRLLEQHELCVQILDAVNHYLASKGPRIATGTIVAATIIAAPFSTKNSKKERDPEMHQPRKGNQWYFGAKTHIGRDSKECIVHSVCTSATSVSDVHMPPDLRYGADKKVWSDAGYQGQTGAIYAASPEAQDMTSRRTKYKGGLDEVERSKNRTKARVRSKVEWPFRILKRVFGYTTVRDHGLKKNREWLLATFALGNLYQHRKRLVLHGGVVSLEAVNGIKRSRKQACWQLIKRFSIKAVQDQPNLLRS